MAARRARLGAAAGRRAGPAVRRARGRRVRIEPQSGPITVSPRALTNAPSDSYRSGLGPMLIDLRRTAIPAGNVPLSIDAGVRRTIVALRTTAA